MNDVSQPSPTPKILMVRSYSSGDMVVPNAPTRGKVIAIV